MRCPSLVQKSRNWAERASKGFGFTLTNMKRKSHASSSAEAVTFSLNFRHAAECCIAESAEQRLILESCIIRLSFQAMRLFVGTPLLLCWVACENASILNRTKCMQACSQGAHHPRQWRNETAAS